MLKFLTMCLTNWKRPQQLDRIIEQLLEQSERPKIFVWNNSPVSYYHRGADWVINSSENTHNRHMPMLWQLSDTVFVGKMDDDLYFEDRHVLADALDVLTALSDDTKMVGAYGVRIFSDSTYSDGNHVNVPKGHGQAQATDYGHDVPVDVLKGRIMLARRHAADKLNCGLHHHHFDLYASTALAGNKRNHHVAASCFFNHEKQCGRVRDCPLDEHGFSAQDSHTSQRDILVSSWLETCLPDMSIKPKPQN